MLDIAHSLRLRFNEPLGLPLKQCYQPGCLERVTHTQPEEGKLPVSKFILASHESTWDQLSPGRSAGA